jgi:hypothetical protein
MSCEKVQEQISLMLDQQLVSEEWERSQVHIQGCRKCEARFEEARSLRAGMRRMSRPPVPPALTARLRVVASHERARRVARANLSARLHDWAGTLRLFVDNLMRPFAVPVTGGLFSAIVLFSFLVPSLMFHRTYVDEPPIAVLTDPEGEIVGAGREVLRLEPGDATISGNEVSLVLLIDERGHVQDYYLSGGELTDEMKSLILLSRFTPATIYGQPTWGLKQVVFPHSRRMRS